MNPRMILLLAGLLGAGFLTACDSGSSSTDSSGKRDTTGNTGGENPDGGTVTGSDYGIPWNAAVTFGSMKDPRDNRTYRTVQVAGKTWMAENLQYVTAQGSWVYQNNVDTGAKYGRLYSWATAMALHDSCNNVGCAAQITANHQGVCPVGWHVSTKGDWDSISNRYNNANDAGRAMRSSKGWEGYSSAYNGTDSLGMRVLPAGAGDGTSWNWLGMIATFWMSYEEPNAKSLAGMARLSSTYGGGSVPKVTGFSVRCVKN